MGTLIRRHGGTALAILIGFLLGACSTPSGRTQSRAWREPGNPALQAFVVSVQLLPPSPTEATRSQVTDALTHLADALKESGTDSNVLARAERIRVLAGTLQDSALPSEVAKIALREGSEALRTLGSSRVRRQYAEATGALARIDSARPVPSQIALVRVSLVHLANGLLATRGLDPAVDAASSRDRDRSRAPAGIPTLDAARRASGLVSQLATASSSELRTALATTLDAIAAALEPSGGPDAERLGDLVQKIRAAAGDLRKVDSLGPGAASRAKAALEAALEAAALVSGPVRSPIADDWLSRARAATAAIDGGTFVAFQRGPLQEACRLLVDVLLVTAASASSGATVAARLPADRSPYARRPRRAPFDARRRPPQEELESEAQERPDPDDRPENGDLPQRRNGTHGSDDVGGDEELESEEARPSEVLPEQAERRFTRRTAHQRERRKDHRQPSTP